MRIQSPTPKKIAGALLLVAGFLALVTPFTPGSWLIFVGAELLGIRILFLDKLKVRLSRGGATMKTMLKGFREFILRGNVVDLAVGVVIGAAFGAVVTALVKDILTPFIAALIKQPDFSALTFTLNGSQFLYGDFLNALISFLIVAASIYFLVVLPINKLMVRFKKPGPAPEATTKKCPECLSAIPKDARKCAYCTSEQK